MVALELTFPNIAFVGCGRVEVALQCFLMKSFSSIKDWSNFFFL